MQYIPLPFFVLFMIGDMKGRKNNNLKLVSICQPMTTIMALLCAVLSFFGNTQSTYTLWIIIGLAISAFADSVLVKRDDKQAFMKGMAMFLVAISIYGVTWTRLSGFQSQDLVITVIALIVYIIISMIFMDSRGGIDGMPTFKVTVGVLIYLLAFCLIVSRAVSTFYGDYFTTTQSILMTTGIVSFFAGDLQLGIYHFTDKDFPMEQAPAFYFVGQLFIALTCSYF